MKALISVTSKAVMDTFFTAENIALAESFGEVVFAFGGKEEVKRLIGDADVYVTCWGSPRLDSEILEAAPKLRLLTHLGSTVVPVTSEEMWERGIRVISGFDYFSESTAEGAVAYMLAALRKIPFYSNRLQKERIWKDATDVTNGLIYKTVGIVSYGGVGRHVVRKLAGFNVKIKVYDIVDIPEADKEKYGLEQCTLEELFSTCDVISLHTPYNDRTHHLIDDRLLSLIKPGALFVNTARGGVVDQAALTRHLANGDFTAALDVYEKEPLDPADPLLSLDNVMLLPHQGGPTVNMRPILTRALVLDSHAYLDLGQPLKNEITRAYAANMSKS